ncbi:hypothetical protein T439DRAFT_327248 [Meredithblackwellia eburnea MCA 4105]
MIKKINGVTFVKSASTSARSLSILVDLPSGQASNEERRWSNKATQDAHSAMLSSPLRRCILTNQVLPSDLMVQLKIVKSRPSTDTGKTGRVPSLLFTPSKILHPRFSVPPHGKGAWILCWNDAVQSLAKKGAYKRLSVTAQFPSNLPLKIHSQMARRVVQEIAMFSERAKSKSATLASGAMRDCPAVEVGQGDWEKITDSVSEGINGDSPLKVLDKDGKRLRAVISFSPSATLREGNHDRLAILVPLDSAASTDATASSIGSRIIPVFNLNDFLSSVVTPPSDLTSATGAVPSLSDEACGALNSLINLFARRYPSSQVGDTSNPSDKIYAIYADEGDQSGRTASVTVSEADVNPLLIALWRCWLWTGEGWGYRKVPLESK